MINWGGSTGRSHASKSARQRVDSMNRLSESRIPPPLPPGEMPAANHIGIGGNPNPGAAAPTFPLGDVNTALRTHIMAGNPPPSEKALQNWHKYQVEKFQQQQQPPPPPGPPPGANTMYGYSNPSSPLPQNQLSTGRSISSPAENGGYMVHSPTIQRQRSAPPPQSSHIMNSPVGSLSPLPPPDYHTQQQQQQQQQQQYHTGGYSQQPPPLSYEQWQYMQYQQYQQYLASTSSPVGKMNSPTPLSPQPPHVHSPPYSLPMQQHHHHAPSMEALQQQLFTGVAAGDLGAIDQCIQLGLSVNLMDPNSSDTILMTACRTGREEIVRYCLQHGAKNDPHPDFGQTALHAAVGSGQFACARILLEEAAGSGAADLICNLTDPRGQNALHVACSQGQEELCILLLNHGAMLSVPDCTGMTALHLACGGGHKACLALLMDHGGDVLIDQPDIDGNTPLHLAAKYGSIACTRLLLETAANVNSLNAAGQTPYALSSLSGQHQIGLLLLKYMSPTAEDGGNDNNNDGSSSSNSGNNNGNNVSSDANQLDQQLEPRTLFGPQISASSDNSGASAYPMSQQILNNVSRRNKMKNVDQNVYSISDDEVDEDSGNKGTEVSIDMPPTPKNRAVHRSQPVSNPDAPFTAAGSPLVNPTAMYKGSLPQALPESPLPRPYAGGPSPQSTGHIRKSLPVASAPVPFHLQQPQPPPPSYRPGEYQGSPMQPPPPPGPPPPVIPVSVALAPPNASMDAESEVDLDYERLEKMSLFDGMTVLESKDTPPPASLNHPSPVDKSQHPRRSPIPPNLNKKNEVPTIAITLELSDDDEDTNARAGVKDTKEVCNNDDKCDKSAEKLRLNCEVCQRVGWCGKVDHVRSRLQGDDDSSSTSSGSSYDEGKDDDVEDPNGPYNESEIKSKVKSMDTKVMRMHEVYPPRNIKGATAVTEYDESYYAQDELDLGVYDETHTTVPPIEEFDCQGALYHVYISEEGYTYYLDMHSGHSQWDDPRIYGLATAEYQSEQSLETLLDNQYNQTNSSTAREQYFTKVLDFGVDDDDDDDDDDDNDSKSDIYRSFSNDDTETDGDFSPDAVKLRVIPREEYKLQQQGSENKSENDHVADSTGQKSSFQDNNEETNMATAYQSENTSTNASTPSKSPRKGRPPPIEILPPAPCTPQHTLMAARKRSPGQSSPYSTPSNRSIGSSSNNSTPTHSLSQRSTPTHRNYYGAPHGATPGAIVSNLPWSKFEEKEGGKE